MFFEVGPFLVGDLDVFALGPFGPAVVEELLIGLDDVFGEDGDVALGRLEIHVSEQGGADVDRQAAVDDFRGEQAPEVVWGEGHTGERLVRLGDPFAGTAEHPECRAGGQHARDGTDLALEQEGHGSDQVFSWGS
ncbi:hypothetical protein [Streptomyces sp. RerS4]|uniref:hypothetical protein n=1 Tax=Streptomyces sp. RerS4 TaxID=2942449 RepID=UPI00201BED04|nr:hypothetical protein [Streptomyces sp. RerS4]UQW99247.1 hypothetical protein M4D82_00850 [Streptomyces sp. RerS4]